MRLLEIWIARDAWARLAQLRKPPKVAYQLSKYEKLVTPELEIIEKQRTTLILKAAGKELGADVILLPGQPEHTQFTAEFEAFLATESDLAPAPIDMEALIEAIDAEKGNLIADNDLALLEPFFTAKPAQKLEAVA